MGSLRINTAPTLGDLAVRLAGRRARNAITGQTLVHAYNRLKDFANGDGVQSLLDDIDEVYSDELRLVQLPAEKISPRIRKIEQVSQNVHSSADLELADWQEFEFALATPDQNLRGAKELLEVLDLEGLNIDNVPLLRGIFKDTLDCAAERLGLSEDEKQKLKLYLQKREEIIRENSCPITRRNTKVLSRDINKIRGILKWAFVKIVINGFDDPEEVKDELKVTYDGIICREKDFVRIESNISEDEILIRAYSKLFVKS